MGRLLLAGVLVVTAVGVAAAGPTRKLRVESNPPGAAVYIDTIENGAACEETPCTITAPLGEVTLIVRLDKYLPEFKMVDVKKGRKPLPVSVDLMSAVGTVVIDSPEGATVEINDEDRGEVPVRVQVPADTVRVVVKLGGKTLYDEFVEVEVNAEREIEVRQAALSDDPDDDDDPNLDDDDGEDDDAGGAIRATGTTGARAHYLQVGLAFDIGFRRFTYSDGEDPFTNSGEVVVGPAVELWPGRIAGVPLLRGLSLFGRMQFSPTHQQVTQESNGMPVGAETFWGALELSVRNRWVFGERVGIEASGGFVRDQVEFNTTQSVLMNVPSADYRSIRLGVRASIVGTIEPYISAENRFVLSGGNLETRGSSSKASGFRFAAGATTKLGPLGARVEGSYSQYTWAFENDGVTVPPAPGATDKIFWISFVLGYQY